MEIYRESPLTAQDILDVGAQHVVLATGASWRKERYDGQRYVAVGVKNSDRKIYTADDIMDGNLPRGKTIIYDEDGYYMGGVVAEKLRVSGLDVTYVTPSDTVSQWAANTSERWKIRTHLMKLGIDIVLSKSLTSFDGTNATLVCEYSETQINLDAKAVVMVTQRKPNDGLYHDLLASSDGDLAALPFTLTRIGDCNAPAIIAAAVYAGHKFARELDEPVDIDEPLRHDRVDVGLTQEGAHLASLRCQFAKDEEPERSKTNRRPKTGLGGKSS